MFMNYCDEYQPHAVRHIYDKFGKKHYDFRWDEAGNLGQVSYCNRYGVFESGRFLYWTEDSRMHVAVDDNHYSYYAYDYSGERRIKLTGDNSVLDVNAEFMSTVSTLENVTLYPSSYMVLTDRGYTKHYYTGMERVAARIGDGGLDVGIHLMNTDSLHARANLLFDQSLEQANHRVLEANDLDCIMSGGQYLGDNGIFVEEIPERMLTDVMTEYGEFIGAMHQASNDSGKSDVYYYHGDHLGSASWITDASGAAVQHLQYLPFGERFVDQRTSGYSERFTFTGKERDSETGFGYFGARYMDYELMTMWLSVDPMADKYPSISPYAYCAWNPVKLVDPDGREVDDYFSKNGKYLGKDNAITNNVRIMEESDWEAHGRDGTINHELGASLSQLFSESDISMDAVRGIYEYYWKESGHGEKQHCNIKIENRQGHKNRHYMVAYSKVTQSDNPDEYFTKIKFRILYIDHDEMKKSRFCDNKYEIINLMDHESRHFEQHAMGPCSPLYPEYDALMTQLQSPSFQKCGLLFRERFRRKLNIETPDYLKLQ